MKLGRLVLTLFVCLSVLAPATPAASDPGPAPSPHTAALYGDESWAQDLHVPGPNGSVQASLVSGDQVYIGGVFRTAGNVIANNVAVFNRTTKTWGSLGFGFDGAVYALAKAPNGDLYAGGGFQHVCTDSACDVKVKVNKIARWNGVSWSAVKNGVTSDVRAIGVTPNGRIYIGGVFRFACATAVCDPAGQLPTDYHYLIRYRPDIDAWEAVLNGLSNSVRAIALIGDDVLVGGDFQHFCPNAGCSGLTDTQRLNFIGRYKPGTNAWEKVFFGVENSVLTITVVPITGGSNIYVGGQFDGYCASANCGSIAIGVSQRILRYNTSSNFWESVGFGVDGDVLAITVLPGEIPVAGGNFLNACLTAGCATKTTMKRVGRFVLTGANPNPVNWTPQSMGDGLDAPVNSLNQAGQDVLVFGSFARAISNGGAVGVGTAAAFNLTNQSWSPIGLTGLGAGNGISALAGRGTTVYAGGQFLNVGNVSANRVAAFDTLTNQWKPLGNGLNGPVQAMLVVGNDLYVGGLFSGICQDAACVTTTPAWGVARWDGSAWAPVGFGFPGAVRALVHDGTSLIAAGDFAAICTIANCSTTATAFRLAKFDGATWQPIGFGVNSSIETVALLNGVLYVGGTFTAVCTSLLCATSQQANRFAKFDGGGALTPAFRHFDGAVHALLPAGSGDLIVGGDFTRICQDPPCTGSIVVNRIVKVNPTAGTVTKYGNGFDGYVRGLTMRGTELFVVGVLNGPCFNDACTLVGATPGIALWRAGGFIPVGSGVEGSAEEVIVHDGAVYVGGIAG